MLLMNKDTNAFSLTEELENRIGSEKKKPGE